VKKVLSCLLVLIIMTSAFSPAFAEDDTPAADERAYQVYIDLEYACNSMISYMREMERLWREAIALESLAVVDSTWFRNYLSDGQRDALIATAVKNWGWSFDDIASGLFGEGFVTTFQYVLNQYSLEKTSLVWAGLDYFTAIGYLDDLSIAKAFLDDAKNGISELMAQDGEYPFLTELTDYYKDASFMYEYIIDFYDNLPGLTSNREDFEEEQHSHSIDFEFIFPSAYPDAEARHQAILLERRGASAAKYASILAAMANEVNALRFAWNTGVQSVRGFHDGMAVVQKNGRYGYMSLTGELVVPCEYEYAFDFHNGVGIVQMDGKYGLVDTTGKVLIPCQLSSVGFEFSDGLMYVRQGNTYGFVNAAGELVIPYEWTRVFGFSEGLAFVKNEQTAGYMDVNGNMVISGNWLAGYGFHEGLAAVCNEQYQWGFINTKGELVIPYLWGQADDFCNGVARVANQNQYGFIDTNGEMIVPCGEYAMAWYFQDEFTAVKKDGKWGFIDTTGALIIPCQFDSAEYVYDGFSVVSQAGKYGLVDITGKLVVDCVWDAAWWSSGYLHVEQNGKCGMTDTTGKVIFPCEYESAYYGDGYFTLVKNGKVSIYDETLTQVF